MLIRYTECHDFHGDAKNDKAATKQSCRLRMTDEPGTCPSEH